MPRHGHDGARAIFHQHEIRDEQRQLGTSKGMDHRQAGVIPLLFLRLDLGGGGAAMTAFFGKGSEPGVLRLQRQRQRMVRRDRRKARTEDRVRPGGENVQIADPVHRLIQLKAELQTD